MKVNYFFPGGSDKKSVGHFFLLLALGMAFSFTACVSKKDIVYFQEFEEDSSDTIPELTIEDPRLQHNDLIGVHVASINMEASQFFNPSADASSDPGSDMTKYLVDSNGEIEMPLIGRVKVAGLTTKETSDTLRTLLEKYLEAPTIRVYLKSFKITILGEVKLPGVYYIQNEKVSLPEALGLAGDMTIYGARKEVQVIREIDNNRVFINADMTRRELFSTNAYFLRPNDIVYVPAGKGRIASADNFYRIAPLVISTLTLISLLYIRF